MNRWHNISRGAVVLYNGARGRGLHPRGGIFFKKIPMSKSRQEKVIESWSRVPSIFEAGSIDSVVEEMESRERRLLCSINMCGINANKQKNTAVFQLKNIYISHFLPSGQHGNLSFLFKSVVYFVHPSAGRSLHLQCFLC